MILHYTSDKPVGEVYSFLSDMQKFSAVHPVIYKVEKKKENEYLFFEKIKFLGFIPYDFSYSVTIEGMEPGKSVKMYSEVQKGVHLRLHFLLSTVNGKTNIQETVETTGKFGVKQVLTNTIKRVHKKLFQNIESYK